MKFLKGFKSKSKNKGASESQARSDQAPPRTDVTKKLSPPILELIFNLVCPHTQDDSYESCEQSATEDACMLCDLRDLAHCAQVCRRWRKLGANVL
jgi:F-box-like